jgi:hypothetical protein
VTTAFGTRGPELGAWDFAKHKIQAVFPSYMCVCMHECVQVSLRGILTHIK